MRAFRIRLDYSVINETGNGECGSDLFCVIAETSEHAREYILLDEEFRKRLNPGNGELSIEIQQIEDVGEAFNVNSHDFGKNEENLT